MSLSVARPTAYRSESSTISIAGPDGLRINSLCTGAPRLLAELLLCGAFVPQRHLGAVGAPRLLAGLSLHGRFVHDATLARSIRENSTAPESIWLWVTAHHLR